MTAALVFCLAAALSAAAQPVALTGGVQGYDAAPGDTLTSIAARFGIEPRILAKDNSLNPNARLHTGQHLVVDNRHVSPAAMDNGIVINVSQRMLYVFADWRLVRAFPVAIGKKDWQTPLGRFSVVTRETDPVWDVPVSIQAEMAREGRPILTHVPPGPDNPLGNRYLALSAPGVGIHGTNQPASIYRFTTHGCIRVHPDDMLELFDLVDTGTVVEIVYQPVMLAALPDGSVFLEIHRDAYGRGPNPEARVRQLLKAAGQEFLIDSPTVRQALREKAGRAVLISRGCASAQTPQVDRGPCEEGSVVMFETEIGLRLTVPGPFDDVVRQTTAALKQEGFGVLTTINVRETLRQKLDVPFRRYVILGACNPPLAHRALQADLNVGLLLPCNVIVYEGDSHETVVAAMAPLVFSTLLPGNPEIRIVAAEADRRLRRAMERLEPHGRADVEE